MADKPIEIPDIILSNGEKLYFASDFHLGAPDHVSSFEREQKIVRWLDEISEDAKGIFLVGDLFDFWFEYKHVVPKGFIRFLGKVAELSDKGIPIYLFTGNHDLWMFDYLPKELGITVVKNPISISVNNQIIYIGHGDGLGPGDTLYKFLKVIFSNSLSQWLFKWLHPNIGIGIAQYWSKSSRATKVEENNSQGNDERLLKYCLRVEKTKHHDLYIFGHRHLPLKLKVADNSTYYSLGEWVHHFTYLELDEKGANIKTFDS